MQKEANDYLIVRSGNFMQIAKGQEAVSQAYGAEKANNDQHMYAGVYNPKTDMFVAANGMRINLRKA